MLHRRVAFVLFLIFLGSGLLFCLFAGRSLYSLVTSPIDALLVCADGVGVKAPAPWICKRSIYAFRANARDVAQLNKSAGVGLIARMNDKEEATKLLKFFISRGVDINSVDTVLTQHGYTALHACALTNEPNEAKFLLANGAKADIRDVDGRTPLELAQLLQQRMPAVDRTELIRALSGR